MRKVYAAHGVAVLEILQLRVNSCAVNDDVIKPRDGRILLDIAILRKEFSPLRHTHFGDGDFLFEEVRRNGNAHIRICFFKLFKVVPFLYVVDHVKQGKKAAFLASALQKRGRSLHKLIENTVVFVTRR